MDSAILYLSEIYNNPIPWTNTPGTPQITPKLTINKILNPISIEQNIPHSIEPLPISNEKISLFPKNDSKNYSNIRWSNRVGRTTQNDTTNPNLLNDINTAAKQAGVIVTITTAKEGHSEFVKRKDDKKFTSLHFSNVAVDIAIVNDKAVQYVKNDVDRFANILHNMGYSKNIESGTTKAFLWQTNGHYDHIHISNRIK